VIAENPATGTGCPTCGSRSGAESSDGLCALCLMKAALDDPAKDEIFPTKFEHFEVVTREDGSPWELGRGAMGTTYKAFDTNLRCYVALKVIAARNLQNESARARFLREARAAARLRHPNVASVFHLGKEDDDYFYAMEFIDGETLERCVKKKGPVEPPRAVEIAVQVCKALAAAEKQQLVHRDIKPANIMLVPEDDGGVFVKVIDFGLAKIAAQAATDYLDLSHGGLIGTPHFASPEQFAETRVDVRSDIYSLGLTLWFMLTGHPPFSGSLEAIKEQQREMELPFDSLTHVPAPLVRLLRFILKKDSAERPQTPGELLVALRRCRKELARQPCLRDKSIAVLPFANQSEEEDRTYFSDGMQEDILTHLAKVKDLRVVSRTSVLRYKDGPRDLREIGEALCVATVLQGTVRRAENRVRVTAQLIEACSGEQLWAETYDRDLTNIFEIQTAIAKEIVSALQANLSAHERAQIEQPPTSNAEAYDFYLRARACHNRPGFAAEDLQNAQRLYERAIELDPQFAVAYAQLSLLHSLLFWYEFYDPSEARLNQAKEALEHARRLRPEIPETFLAAGYYHYYGFRDYVVALQEFGRAERALPNNPEIYLAFNFIQRRQGKFDEAIANVRRVIDLDPSNAQTFFTLGVTYAGTRRYEEAHASFDRAIVLAPEFYAPPINKAALSIARDGDTGPLRTALDRIAPGFDPDGDITSTRIRVCMLERNFDEALQLLTSSPRETFESGIGAATPKEAFFGFVYAAKRDAAKARKHFQNARTILEKTVHDRPMQPIAHSTLGSVYAGLGIKKDAIREGRRAVELLPIQRDAMAGPGLAINLASIYADMGEADLAIDEIEKLLRIPFGLSRHELRLDPQWDAIRRHPRFIALAGETFRAVSASHRWWVGIAAAIVAAALVFGAIFTQHQMNKPPRVPTAQPARAAVEKSIAVLPFENLSTDKENAFFTDGIHQEILTNLARVKDLKVISRTSVMQFKDGQRNLTEIGKALGVATILEGSVQRSGNQVRVTAQLIDAHTDEHLWAGSFDRDLTDVFAIQSAIADEIVKSLQANLSPGERARMERKPTTNTAAYDAYLQGRGYRSRQSLRPENLTKAAEAFQRAVELDPKFALAFANLSWVHSQLYWGGTDLSQSRLNVAKEAVDEALRLEPDLPEAHLSLGYYYYRGYRDYERALAEFAIAQKALPNDAASTAAVAVIQRRQGKWDESIANFEKAMQLDPLNSNELMSLAETYMITHRWDDALRAYDRIIYLTHDVHTTLEKAVVPVQARSDLEPLRKALGEVPKEHAADLEVMKMRFYLAVMSRDFGTAIELLKAFPREEVEGQQMMIPKAKLLGDLYENIGDKINARAEYEKARAVLEKAVNEHPDHAPTHMALGDVYARLGRRKDALREGLRAVEMLPASKDAIVGPDLECMLAYIYARIGEKEKALDLLEKHVGQPAVLPIGELKLDPNWDLLRSEPRFQRLLERPNGKLSVEFRASVVARNC
jgi:TolB-like protein/Tfp pilus assembly protein PilF/predicted Ser/Thr protein kinase